jgi:GNAT superfamily N-acetyltransferase
MLMRTAAGKAWGSLRAQVAARWEAIDPLLPGPSTAPGCGAELVVPGKEELPAAIGICRHWRGSPGSLDLTWGATRRFRLTAWTAGPDVAAALDRLLSLWRDHLAGLTGALGDDTAAVVDWPSRDIGGVASLLRHGLTPLTVIAARPAPRPGDEAPGPGRERDGRGDGSTLEAGHPAAAGTPPGIRIRRAGPADLVEVARLGLELVRFDEHFGCVVERPGTAEALRRQASRLLDAPQPWTWLAERDGTPVALVQAEHPDSAAWIAPMAGLEPAAYLGQMFVAPGERGRGVASALAAHLHRVADAAGVAVTLLHYELLNPLSGPFWNRQGYRPLWTTFEARPARTMR